jgi:transglutaminase-like putative cysteine protease
MISVERRAQPGHRQRVSASDVKRYLPATHLTASDPHIAVIARDLAAHSTGPLDLAERISDWVATALAYGSGATGVTTTAAQALRVGKGLCQDYAHLMLAICRAVKLPARYVSGHMVAEGGSHAWVEVLLPATEPDRWVAVAFDPTNRRQPNLGYTTVAVGRDYRDVSPSSGHYSAPYTGLLSFMKRAGLTLLEYNDGELIDCEGGSKSSAVGLQSSH